MDSSFGAHTEVICRLKFDPVSRPGAGDVGMRELHLERRRFSLGCFNVSQASLDCDFTSCEKKRQSCVSFSPTSTSTSILLVF